MWQLCPFYAASLARTFRASIICINVIEPIVPTVGYSGMAEPLPIADIAEQLEDSAERELPKLAECDERGAGCRRVGGTVKRLQRSCALRKSVKLT